MFFHMQVYARCRHKHVRSLVHNGQVLVDEDRKVEAAYNFFNDILGEPAQRQHAINLDALDLPYLNLAELCDQFIEAKILAVIKFLPLDKAPGPDGFTVRFLQATWDIIRPNFMAAFNALWRLDTRNFHDINETLLILLPKTPEAATLKDYMPILLIHLLGKLFSKVLVNRLAPCLGTLIHPT
jgi:hypothetical protein